MAAHFATAGIDDPPNFTGTHDTLDFTDAGHANAGDIFEAKNGFDVVRIAAGLNIDLRPVTFGEFEQLAFLGEGIVSVYGSQLVTEQLGTAISGAAGLQTLNIFAAGNYSAQPLSFTNWEETDVIAIYGSPASQTLIGSVLNDTIYAGAGNDVVHGRAGNDTLYGEDGNDKLLGISGDDLLVGGAGNDGYWVDGAGDVVIEAAGEGTDTVSTGSISYVLGDNVENLNLTGLLGLNGTGNGGNNVVNGNAGANQLEGLGGNDTLRGQGGNDVLVGGSGRDFLTGGAGADTFVFATGDTGVTGATRDMVQDFSSYEGDLIDLSATDFSSFIGSAAFSHQAGEVRAVAIANGAYLVQGDADGDGRVDFALIVRADGVPLTASDFLFG